MRTVRYQEIRLENRDEMISNVHVNVSLTVEASSVDFQVVKIGFDVEEFGSHPDSVRTVRIDNPTN